MRAPLEFETCQAFFHFLFFSSYRSLLEATIMNQTSKQHETKKRITLDSIPEDVALVVAQEVKSWATIEGSLEEKERARKWVSRFGYHFYLCFKASELTKVKYSLFILLQ